MRLFITLILFLLLTSCDLFTTRTPEPPNTPSGNHWRFPSLPRIAFDNFTSSLERRSIVDYMKSFSTDQDGPHCYRFVPDPQTAADYPFIFADWNLMNEQKFVQSLFNPNNFPLDSLIDVNLSIEREITLGDSSLLNAHYDIYIGHLRTTAPQNISGQMILYLCKLNDSGWYIWRWDDVREPGHSCFSDLKANF